jgi:hypothetical protein
MDPVLDRIDAWERLGLIDGPIAARLRSAEAEHPGLARPADASTPTSDRPRRASASASATDSLGPGPTVAEMFAYLGGGFLLAAWSAFVTRLSGDSGSLVIVTGGLLVAAIVLGALGLSLRGGDSRRRRGAGIAFLGATLYATGAAAGALSGLHVSGSVEFLIVAIVAVAIASVVRFLHAGLLTQFGLLVSVTAVGGAVLAMLGDLVTPDQFDGKGAIVGPTLDPLVMILASAAIWLLVALGLGLLALREANAQRDSESAPGAPARRAGLTRGWAGMVAVVGLASALSRSDLLASGDYGRIVTPWIMDAILLALAGLLVERAFRRDSGAFLFAAGVGLITALTDLNFSYLSGSPEVGLLIEGGLLLGVGFGADRLRRRLVGGRPSGTGAPDSSSDPVAETDPGPDPDGASVGSPI